MRDSNREYIRRHGKLVGSGGMVLGMVLSAIFLPRSFQNVAVVGLVVAFALFYVWAEHPLSRSAEPGNSLTIRQQLKRTRALSLRILIPVVVLWVGYVTLYCDQLPALRRQALAIGVAVALMYIWLLFMKGSLNCPRCGTNFRQERIAKFGRWSMDARGTEDIWDSCPHCSVSFDEPYSR